MQPAASSITTKLTTPFHNILSIHHSLLPLLSSSASPSLRPLSPSPSPLCHVFYSSPLWSFLLTFKPTFAFGRQPSSIFTSASFPIFSTYLEFAPACPSARFSSSHLSFTIRPNFVFHFFFKCLICCSASSVLYWCVCFLRASHCCVWCSYQRFRHHQLLDSKYCVHFNRLLS